MEFVKTAEGDGMESYQAMRRVQGKPKACAAHREAGYQPKCADCATGEVVEVLVPELPEAIDTKPIAAALKEFPGRVRAVSLSVEGGLSVRVEARPAAPCEECGQPVEADWAFCPVCGHPKEA